MRIECVHSVSLKRLEGALKSTGPDQSKSVTSAGQRASTPIANERAGGMQPLVMWDEAFGRQTEVARDPLLSLLSIIVEKCFWIVVGGTANA